jgi:hypothetical protein
MTSRPSKKPRRTVLRVLGRLLLGFVLLMMLAWACAAIYWSTLPATLRPVAAGLFGLGSLALLLLVKPRRRALGWFLVAFAGIVLWWKLIPPSNERNWQPDVAVLPWATIAGDKVTLHNVRNCDYRTETDYTCHYYDKTYDLAKLTTVDLYLVYWGSPLIAHTMMSFGFDGQGYVCFSIETRKEKGEEYSALKGFFRQYELAYIMADERDVVRLRSNYRVGEDVYLFRLKAKPEVVRKVFLSYLREVNRLKEKPQWYNALTSNCTTSIRGHTAPYAQNNRIDWRIIVNGHLDELLYERGIVDRSLPLAELKQRSLINPKARAADKDPKFSQRIREGLPGINK